MDNVNPSGRGLAEAFKTNGRNALSEGAQSEASMALCAPAYMPMLADFDLTDDQTRELYAVLDSIARGFVEYGWSGEVCGKLLDGFQAVLSNAVEPLDSTDPNHEEKGDEPR